MMKKEIIRKIILVLFVSFVYGVIANIAHPVTPKYLTQLGLPDSNFGYFFAAMNLGMLFSAPLWGSFGDKHNRAKMIFFGMLLYGVGQLLFGLFNSTSTIILARVISGLGSGSVIVNLLSYINTSKILSDNKVKVTSSFIIFNILGASVGSALGGILGGFFDFDLGYVMFVQVGILVLFAIFFIIVFNTRDEIKGVIRSQNPFSALKDIKKISRWFIIYLVSLFLISISFVNVTRYLDKYFTDLGKSTTFIGIFALVVGLVTLITNVLYSLKVKGSIKHKKTLFNRIILLVFWCSITLFASFNIQNLVGLYSVYFIYIILRTILEPLTVNFLSECKDVSMGILMGVRQSFISFAGIIGIIVAGYIYNFDNILLFNVCAILFFVSGVILLFLKRTISVEKNESN